MKDDKLLQATILMNLPDKMLSKRVRIKEYTMYCSIYRECKTGEI